MRRKRLWMGSTALATAVVVGAGALTLGSGSSSLVSSSVPTSKLAATLPAPGHPSHPKGMHHGFMMGLRPGSVYSESVLAVKGGGYKTVIGVRGVLTAISSTSISVKRPDTGAIVIASISSTTKFGRTKEATLASDLSSGKTVKVVLVEAGGVAKLIAAMPAPGTRVGGTLTAISSTSISVKRPGTGATASASISSTTKFVRTTEATLASDLSSGKTVRVMFVEAGGVAKLIAAMPAPGMHPLLHGLSAPKSNVSSSSSISAATA